MTAENHVDGILLSAPHQDDKAVAQLRQEHIPIVLIGQLPDKAISPTEDYNPSLTTIRLPGPGLGWASIERLIRNIYGEYGEGLNEASLLLESKLITREANM